MDVAKAVRQRLECLQQTGLDFIPKIKVVEKKIPASRVASAAEKLVTLPPQPVQQAPKAKPTVLRGECVKPVIPGENLATDVGSLKVRPTTADNLSCDQRVMALEVLNTQVKACTRCLELVASRTQTVFGVGDPNARLCFFGEAPGADEDAQGEPFVGRAGQLLNKIIEACTLKREDVYILNVLRCRPPGNRNPTPEEASNCRPFFERQLEIISPEYIVCLGSIAATNLLNTNSPIGKLRGSFHTYRGAKVIATYHPAYLLRNPSAKKFVWEDMKMLMRDMGISVPD